MHIFQSKCAHIWRFLSLSAINIAVTENFSISRTTVYYSRTLSHGTSMFVYSYNAVLSLLACLYIRIFFFFLPLFSLFLVLFLLISDILIAVICAKHALFHIKTFFCYVIFICFEFLFFIHSSLYHNHTQINSW